MRRVFLALSTILYFGVVPSVYAYPHVNIYDPREIFDSGSWNTPIGKYNCWNGNIVMSEDLPVPKMKKGTWYTREAFVELRKRDPSRGDKFKGEGNYGQLVALTNEACDPTSQRKFFVDFYGFISTTSPASNKHRVVEYDCNTNKMRSLNKYSPTAKSTAWSWNWKGWKSAKQVHSAMVNQGMGSGVAWHLLLSNMRPSAIARCIFGDQWKGDI